MSKSSWFKTARLTSQNPWRVNGKRITALTAQLEVKKTEDLMLLSQNIHVFFDDEHERETNFHEQKKD